MRSTGVPGLYMEDGGNALSRHGAPVLLGWLRQLLEQRLPVHADPLYEAGVALARRVWGRETAELGDALKSVAAQLDGRTELHPAQLAVLLAGGQALQGWLDAQARPIRMALLEQQLERERLLPLLGVGESWVEAAGLALRRQAGPDQPPVAAQALQALAGHADAAARQLAGVREAVAASAAASELTEQVLAARAALARLVLDDVARVAQRLAHAGDAHRVDACARELQVLLARCQGLVARLRESERALQRQVTLLCDRLRPAAPGAAGAPR